RERPRTPFLIGAGEVKARTTENDQRQRKNYDHGLEGECRRKTKGARRAKLDIPVVRPRPIVLAEHIIDVEAERDRLLVPRRIEDIPRAQIDSRPCRKLQML